MNAGKKGAEKKTGGENEILFRQRHMGSAVFVGWLIVVFTVQWMSLDIYLPAMPQIRDAFSVTEAQLNLTLSIYVISCAVGTIVSGPLSDKYGRKRPILTGMVLFVLFNLLSAASPSLVSLIIFRSIAGLGSGAVCTIVMAMIKDSLAGRRFQQAMTFLQSLAIIGPILAPVAGAFIISWLSWRGIFIFLTIAAAASAIPLFLMDETLALEKRVEGNVWRATCGLFTILKNKGFTLFLLVISLLSASWYSYMAVCSYIYLEDFGLSYYMYSLYYGLGATASFIAPFLYLYLSSKLRGRTILQICFAMIFGSGLLIFLFGAKSSLAFFLLFLIFLLAEGMSRPLGMVILLDQREDAIGAASSVSNFTLSVLGVVGTSAATLPWNSYLSGLGIILMASVALSLIVWIPLLKTNIKIKGL